MASMDAKGRRDQQPLGLGNINNTIIGQVHTREDPLIRIFFRNEVLHLSQHAFGTSLEDGISGIKASVDDIL